MGEKTVIVLLMQVSNKIKRTQFSPDEIQLL